MISEPGSGFGTARSCPAPILHSSTTHPSATARRLLRPGGVYSFFNGLAPDNLFFHLVYGEIAKLELGR